MTCNLYHCFQCIWTSTTSSDGGVTTTTSSCGCSCCYDYIRAGTMPSQKATTKRVGTVINQPKS